MTATVQLYASALNRVVACNGSYAEAIMSEVPPDAEQTDDAREGDAAHFVAMDVLRGVISDPSEYIDRKMPNGVYVTADMADYAAQFTDHVKARGERIERYIEVPSDFDISPRTRILARPDCVTWDSDTRTLTIDDFKYGYRLVEPSDNWTLVGYVMSAIQMIEGEVPEIIRRIIHQPRPHHEYGKIRVYETTYDVWYAEYGKLQAALETLSNELHTGEHCYKCPGRMPCRALRDATYNAIDMSHEVFNDKQTDAELEIERIEIMRAVARLEQRLDATSELIMHRIENGAVYQNHYIDREQYGHYKFNPGITPELIRTISGIDVSKTTMLTPAQAIKKGVPEVVAKSLSTRPKLAAKLVNKSASERAAKLFGKTPTKGA